MPITIEEVMQCNINLLIAKEQAEQKVRELTSKVASLEKELSELKKTESE